VIENIWTFANNFVTPATVTVTPSPMSFEPDAVVVFTAAAVDTYNDPVPNVQCTYVDAQGVLQPLVSGVTRLGANPSGWSASCLATGGPNYASGSTAFTIIVVGECLCLHVWCSREWAIFARLASTVADSACVRVN